MRGRVTLSNSLQQVDEILRVRHPHLPDEADQLTARFFVLPSCLRGSVLEQ